ncbi:MAG: hypothetical protein R6V85_09330 [Polyangia bacterium]
MISSRLAVVLLAAPALAGCDLFLDNTSRGPEVAADESCPGYEGEDPCCSLDDPCGWAGDGQCDCQGTCPWDADDCAGGPDGGDTDTGSDPDGGPAYCEGYQGDDPCCIPDDPCGWADDGYCDCEGCDWDAADCT